LLGLHPFWCQLCGHRFWAFHKSIQSEHPESERRQYERIQVSFPMSFAADELRAEGTVLDLSLGGCAFKAQAPLSQGAVLQLQFQPTGAAKDIKVDAAVVQSVRSVYFSTEFLRLQPDERYRLIQLIAGVLIDRRAKGSPDPGPARRPG
jgi:hypothetical protein